MWELEDIEEAARRSSTFFIPSLAERRTLCVGRLVRLHFLVRERVPDGPRAERMWVEIAESRPDGSYSGYLTNQPTSIPGLSVGDLIDFGSQHVARVLITRDDPRWNANAELAALVSESVFEECCRWMYREVPDNHDDSGWRLFSGTETHEQLSDAGRIRVCNVSWLCDYDPSLAPMLKREDCVAFERTGASGSWTEIAGWAPERE